MYRFLFILLILTQICLADGGKLSGIITNSETGDPLVGANISFVEINQGAVSDAAGNFEFSDLVSGEYQININYLGFKSLKLTFVITENHTTNLEIQLEPSPLYGKEVVILANRAERGKTPVAFSTLEKEKIDQLYHAQDIPVMLSELPSAKFYSESGNGIGYNYLSIRGFDQRRISIMINGVPQNDPEDHNNYWHNMPDFLENVEDIQVQRGAGSAFYGPPAIGGSVNILTSHFSNERKIQAGYGFGSYNTRKKSISFNSGLIKNNYVVSARLSQITSDGYRDNSWVDFKSYFIGLARFGKKSSTRIHFYGGPVEDGLAYNGLPKFVNKDKTLRKLNLSYFGTNADTFTYKGTRSTDEIENFNQPHFELIHEYQLSKNIKINNTFFGIKGYGFFDYDGSWAPMSYFRITPENGFDISDDPENVYISNLVIRAYVDNEQAGWLPQIQYTHSRGEVVLGSELRFHRSLHWGRIQKAGNDIPQAITGQYSGYNHVGSRRYYEYKGAKDIISPFIHSLYQIDQNLSVMLDLQLAYNKYRLYDEKFIGTDFTLDYLFLNPRIGVNYKINPELNIFTSFSRTSREPRLKNFYDAAEASTPASWGAVVPQFNRDSNGNINFDDPLVKPERLNDIELGIGYNSAKYSAAVNLFYMDFQDEIVKKGQLDRFGQPVTGNADKTTHSGIELSAAVQLNENLNVSGNYAYSKNILKEYRIYDGDEIIVLDDNPIAGFPNSIGNLRGTYHKQNFISSISMQYAGKQYTDNFKNEENTVDAFTVFHGMIGYSLKNTFGGANIEFSLHVQNIFDKLYILHGEGDEFFPAAERNIFFNTKIGL